jgi:acyl dehydratase
MTLFPERVGVWAGARQTSWAPPDCTLYALSVGAGFSETSFVLEPPHVHHQSVFPTFLLALVSADANSRDDALLGIGTFSPDAPIVLGEQRLDLHRPVEPSGRVSIDVKVAALYDKGSGAVVVLEVNGSDAAGGAPAFTAMTSMFVVGAGGFGGERDPKRERTEWPPRDPDRTAAYQTLPVQSLLFMHAGKDDHAIHVEPGAAAAAGFDGPILTGQNSLGVACRAVVQELCGGDARAIRSIGGTFAQPAYNGDVLSTEMWTADAPTDRGDRVVVFRTVNQDGTILIDGGRCELQS